ADPGHRRYGVRMACWIHSGDHGCIIAFIRNIWLLALVRPDDIVVCSCRRMAVSRRIEERKLAARSGVGADARTRLLVPCESAFHDRFFGRRYLFIPAVWTSNASSLKLCPYAWNGCRCIANRYPQCCCV